MGGERREWLLVRDAGERATRVELGRSALRIGRDSGNQLVLLDTFASGQHAELVEHRGRRCLTDLGSTNGTRLNGQSVAPGRPAALHDGDVIQIGRSDLTYRRDDRDSSASGGFLQTILLGLPGAHSSDSGAAPVLDTIPAAAPAPERQPSGPGAVQRAGRQIGRWLTRLALRLLLALLLVAVVIAGAAWLLAPARLTLLVLGSDARPDEFARGEVGRTDTMLAVVADRSPSQVGLISVPRDLWVEIPGHGAERINAAYVLGGPSTAERVVGDTLGLSVDRYLTIGLQGVRDVVDAAGGVEIDVPQPIHDDAYPTDDYGTMVLDIPAGRQHMDGETALRYARTRHQDNDFGRMARQQQVLVAVRSAMLRPTHWWRVPLVVQAVRQATSTDLGPLDLATIALAFGTGPAEPDRLTLDFGVVEEFRGAGGAYLLRPAPSLRPRVAGFLAPAAATVEVLNGTATAGLATQTADRLRGQGVRVVNIGNAGLTRGATTVEVRPGFRRAGAHVAALLQLPTDAIHESPLPPDGPDVRVTLAGG